MSTLNKLEIQVIQAFSSADLPERIFRDSNIQELINGIAHEQKVAEESGKKLDKLRDEQKNGNVITNWWNDRDDQLQEAQIDLSKSISSLTQKSSQLLVINTAISKVLNDQQRILLEQQNILKTQTDTLEEQNRKILEQQKLLEKQQQDINQANQGLMEAKGITQEQAHKLVGCVDRVTKAENKIDIANEKLRSSLEQRLNDSIAHCIKQLNVGFGAHDQRHEALQKKLQQDMFSTLELKSLALLETVKAAELKYAATLQEQSLILNVQSEALKSTETQLTFFQSEQQKINRQNRLALSGMVCLALSSIGWQIALYFL